MDCRQHILNCLVQLPPLQLIYRRRRFQDFAITIAVVVNIKLGCLKEELKDLVNKLKFHLRVHIEVDCEYCPPVN